MSSKRFNQYQPKYLLFSGWGVHFFYLDHSGKLFAGGFNRRGCFGIGNTEGRFTGRSVPFEIVENKFFEPRGRRSVRNIQTGEAFTVFHTKSNEVFVVGCNSYGQLMIEKSKSRIDVPSCVHPNKHEILSRKEIVHVSAGVASTYCTTKHGEVFCSGFNGGGELCLNHKEKRYSPTQIKLLKHAIEFTVAGYEVVFFFAKNGRLFSGGWNKEGSLAVVMEPKTQAVLVPTEVLFFRNNNLGIKGFGLVQHTSYFLTSGKHGELATYICGDNSKSQFGNDATKGSSLPQLSKEITPNVRCMGFGGRHFFFYVDSIGRVFGCGSNRDVTAENFPKFREVCELRGRGVCQIVCANRFALFYSKINNDLYAIGEDVFNQISKKQDTSGWLRQLNIPRQNLNEAGRFEVLKPSSTGEQKWPVNVFVLKRGLKLQKMGNRKIPKERFGFLVERMEKDIEIIAIFGSGNVAILNSFLV